MTTEDGDDLAGLIPERVDSNTPAPCHAMYTKTQNLKPKKIFQNPSFFQPY